MEDQDDNVTSLVLCCQTFLLKYLHRYQHVIGPFLQHPDTDYRQRVIDLLPVGLNPFVAFQLVEDQGYWQRNCKHFWSSIDVGDYGHDWRNAFAQKTVEEFAENFSTNEIKLQELTNLASWASRWITNLVIKQVPIDSTNVSSSTVSSSCVGDHIKSNHCDVGQVIVCFSGLRELTLSYGIIFSGANFTWDIYSFSLEDCVRLSEALQRLGKLQILRLMNNNMTDVHVYQLIPYLTKLDLKTLSLAHNNIGDDGMSALCQLLSTDGTLEELNLTDNVIGDIGAEKLAAALTDSHLKELVLRLNIIGDKGAERIFKSVSENEILELLDLASNRLSKKVLTALHEMIVKNKSLRRLDISISSIGEDDCNLIENAMACNSEIVELNLQLCQLSATAEKRIASKVRKNADDKSFFL